MTVGLSTRAIFDDLGSYFFARVGVSVSRDLYSLSC